MPLCGPEYVLQTKFVFRCKKMVFTFTAEFRFNLLCSSCGCSRRVDSDGNTALILAARVGNRAAVQAAMCTAQQCNPAHCAALGFLLLLCVS